MGMPAIPRRDLDALGWMRGFVLPIVARPQVYGVSPSDAQTMLASFRRFEQAMDANKRAVSCIELRGLKNVARRQAQQLLMLYYHQIKVNHGVSDASKIAIGVNPVNRNRRERIVPGTQPVIEIIAATNGRHILDYKDSGATNRAKPFGATSLELRVNVGDDIDLDPENARPVADYSRNPMLVAYGHEDDGKKATYFGRWKSARNETGPWSIPVSMRIAA